MRLFGPRDQVYSSPSDNVQVLYLGTQVGERSALIREGLVVHNVPVEDIELVVGHGILEMVGRNATTLSLSSLIPRLPPHVLAWGGAWVQGYH